MRNKITVLTGLMFSSIIAIAQTEETPVEEITTASETGMTWFNIPNLVGVVFVIFLIYATLRALNIMARRRDVRLYEKYGLDIYQKQKSAGWWERMKRMATSAVPLERERDVQLDHDYDGIKELDNDLPPWWVWMFYITIFIGVVYFAYYHVFDLGLSSTEQYEVEMARAQAESDASQVPFSLIPKEMDDRR